MKEETNITPIFQPMRDRLVVLFNEWKKRAIENPEEFNPNYADDEDYGEVCADYLITLDKELK